MGILRTTDSLRADLEEFSRLFLGCAPPAYSKPKFSNLVQEEVVNFREGSEEEEEDKLVCVTSGASFLGLAIVNRLLNCGYSVRILIENQEDLEKLEQTERFVGGGGGSTIIGNHYSNNNRRIGGATAEVVMAKVAEVESLCEAFRGCRGVFHTSAFADPAGISGYSKCMAELEVKASQNVMDACARTASVRKCVFTSSLLACVWRNNVLDDLPPLLDHSCWSEESVCREKKLWLALGKTMAEKAAWRVAEDHEIKLATICPGFITGPEFCRRNPTSSIAYLKGAQEMYAEGLLATADVSKVAEAHVCVYEAMSNTGCGRYICFDHVIQREEDVLELAGQMGIPANRITSNAPSNDSVPRFQLSNGKLSRLMSRLSRCS
ncbi:3-beta hydroxysteroid dehydrogenase/isomerase [Macleaya cordata]|uniref:3-beta hydroxysteroid dehydrogenase/isomerase n=1 Tax=Macleaya cordata TaxID=56857 RepID=A0A200QAU5_MACCD|nr:3-beta hydroxysteroid dehydrogenase/isomerase [Macleaya cordata]